ncbi:MAG: cytochrome C [Rhodothermales bacterium]
MRVHLNRKRSTATGRYPGHLRLHPLPVVGTILLLTAWGLTGCEAGSHHLPHSASLLNRIENDTTRHPNGNLSSELHLEGISRIEVEGFAPLPTFYVQERLSRMEQYPCTECHTEPLAALTRTLPAEKDAHWDVSMQHADEDVMVCATCHTIPESNALQLLNGKNIDFNHSYRQCAQCHTTQATDWAGGAHGKRLGGWAPPRVVSTCTDCHDPHQPGWEPRWPARASRLIPER